jgi:hypothetical protein
MVCKRQACKELVSVRQELLGDRACVRTGWGGGEGCAAPWQLSVGGVLCKRQASKELGSVGQMPPRDTSPWWIVVAAAQSHTLLKALLWLRVADTRARLLCVSFYRGAQLQLGAVRQLSGVAQ